MKVVDVNVLFPDGKYLNAIYSHIEQPMFIYHNQEEFEANVTNAQVVDNFGTYHSLLTNNGIDLMYRPDVRYISLKDKNIWVKTVDEFIPDYADFDGTIYYIQKDNQFIPTNGCYVKLYFITCMPSRHVLYTSSGIHTVGITKWDVTAGVRKTFLQEKDTRKGKSREEAYQDYLGKILRRKAVTVQFTKAAGLIFNPMSDCFLDAHKALKTVFKTIKANDIEKLTESKGFQMAIQQTLKTIFPALAKTMKEKHTPEKMAEYLSIAMGVAEDEKNVDKMLKVFDKITEIGYQEIEITQNNVPVLPPTSQMSMGNLPTAEEVKVPEKEEAVVPNPDKITEEELKQRKEDLDYPDYTQVGFDLEDFAEEDEKTQN